MIRAMKNFVLEDEEWRTLTTNATVAISSDCLQWRLSRAFPVETVTVIGLSSLTRINYLELFLNGDARHAIVRKEFVAAYRDGVKPVTNQMILELPNADDSYFRIAGL